MTCFRYLLILALLGPATPCAGGAVKQAQGDATLEVSWEGDERKLGLADQITVTLRIEGNEALNVYGAPLDLGAKANWLLVERSKDTKMPIRAKRVRWQLVYKFAPREPGREIAFAFPEVRYRDGDERAITWEPITFEVTTQITAPETAKLKGIAAIEELPAIAPPEESAWRWLLLGILPVVGIAIFALWLIRRRARSRSAVDLALYELQRLVGMKLPEKGNSERFITLLTMLVRRYLERQYALPARRRTTPEFVRFLASCETWTTPEKDFLTSFLQRCEAVKFAKAAMSVAECGKWVDAVRQFLQPRKVTPKGFTERARKVMQFANQEAHRFDHEYIGTEHILLGLVKEGSGVAANVLKKLDIDLGKTRVEVEKIVQAGPAMVTLGTLPQTPRAKKVIEYASEEARALNHNYVGTEHLLLGLLREHESVAAQVLMNLGLRLEDVRREVLNLLGYNLPPNGSAGASPSQQ
jgi:Clp amino terminal domain, pathogenicity island component